MVPLFKDFLFKFIQFAQFLNFGGLNISFFTIFGIELSVLAISKVFLNFLLFDFFTETWNEKLFLPKFLHEPKDLIRNQKSFLDARHHLMASIQFVISWLLVMLLVQPELASVQPQRLFKSLFLQSQRFGEVGSELRLQMAAALVMIVVRRPVMVVTELIVVIGFDGSVLRHDSSRLTHGQSQSGFGLTSQQSLGLMVVVTRCHRLIVLVVGRGWLLIAVRERLILSHRVREVHDGLRCWGYLVWRSESIALVLLVLSGDSSCSGCHNLLVLLMKVTSCLRPQNVVHGQLSVVTPAGTEIVRRSIRIVVVIAVVVIHSVVLIVIVHVGRRRRQPSVARRRVRVCGRRSAPGILPQRQ